MSALVNRSIRAGGGSGPGSARTHSAPWARAQKWISAVVLVFLASVVVMVMREVPSVGVRLVSAGAVLGIVAAGLMSVVRGYDVTDREIWVRRLLWGNRLPLAGLLEVRADAALTRGSLRLLGNGGFFSTTGIFWNRRLGRYRMLANDVSRSVLLRYAYRKVVVAPDDPARFAHEVARRAGLTV